MKLSLLDILNVPKETECEYQIRYIDGPIFYKREKGEDTLSFVGAEEFAENAHNSKIIKWDKKEEK